MKFNERHVRFTLAEEARLIDSVRKIELTHTLTADEKATLKVFRDDFIDRDLDLYTTTWKSIELMFKSHGIKVPVDSLEQPRFHATKRIWYTSRGNGNFYKLIDKKSKMTPDERKEKRQGKRLAAWDKAYTRYHDIRQEENAMNDDIYNVIMKEVAASKMHAMKAEELARKAGVKVKADVIDINKYLNRGDEK